MPLQPTDYTTTPRTSVGVLALALTLAAAFTVWMTDLAGARIWTTAPERVEK